MDAHRPLRLGLERDGRRRPRADAVPGPRWDSTPREPRRRNLPRLRGPSRVPVSGGPVDHPRPHHERGIVHADHRVRLNPDAMVGMDDPGLILRTLLHPPAQSAIPDPTPTAVSFT